jgi:hypothetical protein
MHRPAVTGSTIPQVSDQLPELRASDSDRERTVEVLRHAASDGQLTVDELEQRVSTAYAARTRRELERLTADVSVLPSARDGDVEVSEGPGGTRWVVSIMGGSEVRRGRKLSKAEKRKLRDAERRRELER